MALFYYSTGIQTENGQRIQEQHPLQPSLFLTKYDECQWMNKLIKCNDDGYITTISLSSMNLSGSIPKE